MATVTKPIALDESLNTTESPSRNIADVLAEELSAMITAIGGLNFINFVVVAELPTTGISTTTIYLVPSDDPQSENTYDEYINLNGTISGWEKIGSTDIDLSGYYTSAEVDALLADKADVSDIPTVNDGTLTIQQNGETKGTFTANQSGNSTVNIEIPTTDIQTAVDEFETYNGGLLSECIIELVPVQSGSGTPSPDNVRPISGHTEVDIWNHQKNLLVYPYSDSAKTESGMTYGLDNGIISMDGTSTANVDFYFRGKQAVYESFGLPTGTYTFSLTLNKSVPSGLQWWLVKESGGNLFGEAVTTSISRTVTLDANEKYRFFVRTGSGTTINDLTVKPQIEEGSTATAYEPYLGKSYVTPLGTTIYMANIDMVSGGCDVIGVSETYDGSNDESWQVNGTGTDNYYFYLNKPSGTMVGYSIIANEFETEEIFTTNTKIGIYNTSSQIRVRPQAVEQSIADWRTFLSNNPLQVFYELATPQHIQLSPQLIQTLVGENNLSAPLEGQTIDEVKYRQVFTFEDVVNYINGQGA